MDDYAFEIYSDLLINGLAFHLFYWLFHFIYQVHFFAMLLALFTSQPKISVKTSISQQLVYGLHHKTWSSARCGSLPGHDEWIIQLESFIFFCLHPFNMSSPLQAIKVYGFLLIRGILPLLLCCHHDVDICCSEKNILITFGSTVLNFATDI